MHPINHNNFGATGIEVSYYNGTSVVNGYIVKQVGPAKFNVTDGSHPATVMLAPTVAIATAMGAANAAYCTIVAVPVSATAVGAAFVVHYAVDTAVLTSGGTGYAINDVLTVTSGGGATITVSTVDGSGVILTYARTAAGSMTALPANPVAVTGGAGTGAHFNLKYKVGTITASGGSGYVVGETLSFANMTATTLPTAHVATLSGTAVATVTVDTVGGGITAAATGIGVNGVAEHVSHIYDNRVVTAEGNYYPWSLVTSVDGSAVLQIF